MIVFESILTTFQSSIIFRGSWGNSENWFEPKIGPQYANLACQNPWNALYHWTSFNRVCFSFQPYIYCAGVIGTGVTMSLLPYATDGISIYAVCAVSGVFSACFIGIWNSLIKDEVGNVNFYTVYSHSLGICGIVQFLVTILVVFLVQAR